MDVVAGPNQLLWDLIGFSRFTLPLSAKFLPGMKRLKVPDVAPFTIMRSPLQSQNRMSPKQSADVLITIVSNQDVVFLTTSVVFNYRIWGA